jgi:phosphoribosylamine---glycine ligase
MHVLVIGGGGREHAICHALARSPGLTRLSCAPGNAGIGSVAELVPIEPSQRRALLQFCEDQGVGLVVIGPEAPLVAGLAEELDAAGFHVVGPTAAAAQLEGSKAFAKAFMARHGIPAARSRTFSPDEVSNAEAFVASGSFPIVLKADGLASGKGVVIAENLDEAKRALREILVEEVFGAAGRCVVVEEFLEGEEASVFVLTDGRDYVLLPTAQDHKRIGEGDTGPNTGGMGAYAPAPVATIEVMERVEREIIQPTLQGMAEEGRPYQGVLYCGLMITESGPRVIEFNCRLGDPEAQVILPLLDTDVLELFDAVARTQLRSVEVRLRDGAAACVVLASEGYPATPTLGRAITGLENVPEDALVFHAGTLVNGMGTLVTAGGRVLGVTGLGPDLQSALDRAYAAVEAISFEGMQFRQDIGRRGLERVFG